MILKNSKIPITYEDYNTFDYQTHVRFRISQGESPIYSQNTEIGEITILVNPKARGQKKLLHNTL